MCVYMCVFASADVFRFPPLPSLHLTVIALCCRATSPLTSCHLASSSQPGPCLLRMRLLMFDELMKRERQRDRETERQRDRETERQRDRETQRHRDTETQRHRDRDRDRDRDRQTEGGRGCCFDLCRFPPPTKKNINTTTHLYSCTAWWCQQQIVPKGPMVAVVRSESVDVYQQGGVFVHNIT